MRSLRRRLASRKILPSNRRRVSNNEKDGDMRVVLGYPPRQEQSPITTPQKSRSMVDGRQVSLSGQEAATPPPNMIPTSPEARSPMLLQRRRLPPNSPARAAKKSSLSLRRRSLQQKRVFSRLSSRKHYRRRFIIYAGAICLNYYLRSDTVVTDVSTSHSVQTPNELLSGYLHPSITKLSFHRSSINRGDRPDAVEIRLTNGRKRTGNAFDGNRMEKKRKILDSCYCWASKVARASSRMWTTYGGAGTKLPRIAKQTDASSTKGRKRNGTGNAFNGNRMGKKRKLFDSCHRLVSKLAKASSRMWTTYGGASTLLIGIAKQTDCSSTKGRNRNGTGSSFDGKRMRKKQKLFDSCHRWVSKLAKASSRMWTTYGGASTKLLRVVKQTDPV
eukprot:scaffold2156_cov115-Cylindrotheca_fusiformis.AAC.8